MLVEVEDTTNSHMDMDNHDKPDITSVLHAIHFFFFGWIDGMNR